MAFSGSINAAISLQRTSPIDLSTPTDALSYPIAKTLTDGTAADQARYMFSDTRTLAATTENLDLAGSLVDGLGATLTFATIRGILIVNKSTTAGYTLTVGGAASNAFSALFGDATDKIVIRPGGTLLLLAPADGYTVTAGTGDILKMDSGSNSVNYDIVIWGT